MIKNRAKGFGFGTIGAALLSVPVTALAQAPTTPLPSTPTAAPEGGGVGLVGVVAALIVLIVAIGIAVKFYDLKRKREEEGVVFQAWLSDALLLHPSLVGMPVVASVHMPMRRGSPPLVEVKGTVANQDAREIAMQLVQRELGGVAAEVEDEIIVDPLAIKRVAA